MVGRPARDVALAWCRGHAPDLRLQHIEGASAARFTLGRKRYELVAEGPSAADDIVQRVWETIREEHGMPVRDARTPSSGDRTAEQEILTAALRGDDEMADQLARDYVMGRPVRAIPARARRPRDAEPGTDTRQELVGTRTHFRSVT